MVRVYGQLSHRLPKCHTISSNVHIKYIAHLDVDGSKESLILSLELFLVKNLNCEDTLVGDGSMVMYPKAQNVRTTIHW